MMNFEDEEPENSAARVVADQTNVIYLVKEEDIKPDVSALSCQEVTNSTVGVDHQDPLSCSTYYNEVKNETSEDELTIKQENIDYENRSENVDFDYSTEGVYHQECVSTNYKGPSKFPTTSFYSSKRRRSCIERLIATVDATSDCDEELGEDDDDVLDPDFYDSMMEVIVEEDDCNTEEADVEEEPITVTKENSRNTKQVHRTLWERMDQPESGPIPVFHSVDENYLDDCETPFEYFKSFFTDDLLNEICSQSNLYALTANPNKPLNLTSSELEQWLGISMQMSVTKILNTRLHWSEWSFNDKIASIMTRKRWEKIKSNLHLVDNSTIDVNDKLSKVRLLVDHLQTEFKKIPKLENLCVDEQIVPFKGASSMKQYIRNKPYKWGYKIFILADNEGVVYDFFPYAGPIPEVTRHGVQDLGASSNSVLQLCESVPDDKNHKIYFDNWFTSEKLVEHLATRKIWACGTVQERRLHNTSFKTDKQLQKLGRGAYDELQTTNRDVRLSSVKWFDNRAVCLLSSFLTSQPILKCRRYDKKTKTYVDVAMPNIVSEYNKNMGGVDQHDQQMAYYRMSFKSKKYYMRLIFHFIDMTVVNSWKLLRRKKAKRNINYFKRMSLCEFKLRLSDSLMFTNKDCLRKRGRPSEEIQQQYEKKRKVGNATKALPQKDTRTDGIGHWPSFHHTRGTCKSPGCSAKKSMYCLKCKVHLCCDKENNCFLAFHTN